MRTKIWRPVDGDSMTRRASGKDERKAPCKLQD